MSDPTIDEMRHELDAGHAARMEFYSKAKPGHTCSKCGNEHAAWWYVLYGKYICNSCVSAHDAM